MSLVRDLIGERQVGLDFAEWAHRNIKLDDGRMWDMSGRVPLHEIVANLRHPQMTIIKGAQTGFSTLFLAYSFWILDQLQRNCIYFLPTQVLADRISQTRFDPYVARSEYLKERLRGTDSKGLKEINTHFLYMLGLNSVLGAISVPSDVNLYDEVDLTNPDNVDWSEDRISASDLAWRRFFSVGMFPGLGIDEREKQGDQRRWLVRCGSCNHDQSIEESFPQNFIKLAGKPTVVCVKCGKPIDTQAGRWVALHPDRSADHISYRVPQIIMPGLNLTLIWNRLRAADGKPQKMARLRCSVLGIPDGGALQPVTDAVIQRAQELEPYHLVEASHRPTAMGIDMGDLCHLWILEPLGGDLYRTVWFEEVDAEDLVERCHDLERRFNIHYTCVDAMPYKTESKRLVRSLRRPAAIQYFRGDEVKTSEEGEGVRAVAVVTVDRDESLDETTGALATSRILIPKPRNTADEKLLQTVSRHLKGLVKEEKRTASGEVISYRHNVANHFGMALNSARIACQLAFGVNGSTEPPKYESAAERRTTFAEGAF